ncbi:IS4 family transposase [Desulfovibrio falkowii]
MSHHNTLFAQTLSLIPRHVFQKLENKHKTGRSSRKFGFKEQFTVMAFIQLAARRSMRDGLRCLSAAGSRLYHWGLKSVARSTFADANNSRPVGFFQNMFAEMYALCRPQAPKHKFRFKSKLFSLDATTIKLCLSLFPWASFRQRKGGVKMHTLLDHDGYIPAFVTVTEARTHESRMVSALDLPKGSIMVFDKGYFSYPWFRLLGEKGIFFVTRLKQNAVYKLLERRPVNRKTGVTSDHIIKVTSKGKTLRLRRVGYRDPETGKHYEFVTNNFRLAPKTIADIYKDRWQIEIFFREIKQNLRIKTFVGNTENAVLIQIYTALTVYLLLAYQKFLSRIGLSVQQIFQVLQLNLLGSASLEELLNPRRRKSENIYNLSMLELKA